MKQMLTLVTSLILAAPHMHAQLQEWARYPECQGEQKPKFPPKSVPLAQEVCQRGDGASSAPLFLAQLLRIPEGTTSQV